ncbi:Ig-like domain-containing protein [Singulisphaera sp. PoT]|uniref:Ig-like domain-containing protein n=1 Tax=Singulisphaera sp. PoT TaxID=3411797 RepID=UPI003BF5EA93
MRTVKLRNDSSKDRPDPRKAAQRRSRLRVAALEGLEVRTLLSSMPGGDGLADIAGIDASASLAAPTGVRLDPATDSGAHDDDGITNFNNDTSKSPVNSPIFDVTGVAPGVTLQLYRYTNSFGNPTPVLVSQIPSGAGGTVKVADTNAGKGTIAGGATYYYFAVVKDAAGNTSEESPQSNFVYYMAGPPIPPGVVTLAPAYDTGPYHDGRNTNFNNDPSKSPVNTPVFELKGSEPGQTVQLYRAPLVNGEPGTFEKVGEVVDWQGGDVPGDPGAALVADTNGGHGIIPNGAYVYLATCIDVAGNPAGVFGFPTTVWINVTPPATPGLKLDAASDTGTSHTDGLTNITHTQAPVFDFSGVLFRGSIDLFRNGTLVGSASLTLGGTVQLSDATLPADGTYTYTARQMDLQGNYSAVGSPITVVYDTKTPAAPSAPTLDPASDTGTKGDDSTSSTSPTFDLSGIEAKAIVRLYRDGVVVATITNAAPVGGVISIKDPGPVGFGSHVYTASQTDLAGNVGPIGAGTTIDFKLDPPTGIRLDASTDSGTYDDDGVTNFNNDPDKKPINTPIFDVTGVGANLTVQLYRTSTTYGIIGPTILVNSIASGAGGTVKVADINAGKGVIADGSYLYHAVLVDAAGNSSPAGPDVRVEIDSRAPIPPGTLLLDPSVDTGLVRNGHYTNFNNDPSKSPVNSPIFDVNGVEPHATVLLYRYAVIDGVPGEEELVATLVDWPGTATGEGGTALVADTNLGRGIIPNGTYIYQANQVDLAGNGMPTAPGGGFPTSMILNATPPPAPGLRLDAASDTGPSNSDGITSITHTHSPIFDLSGIVAGSTVELLRDGKVVTSHAFSSGGTIQLGDATAPADGSYTYTAMQTDLEGNVSPIGTPITVVYDTKAPAAPSAPVLDPASATINGTTTRTVTNVVFDVSGVVPGGVVTLYRDDKAVATATSAAGGMVKLTDPGTLTPGKHTYKARQTSAAGVQGPAGSTPLTVTFLPTGTVQGDYNGDGKVDFAVYRRDSSGQGIWFIPNVTPTGGVAYGSATDDVPVQGDFLGQGKDQIALYRPSTATWYIPGFTGPNGLQYGAADLDIPVPGDYYGNGTTQVAVYRPTTGQWFVGGTADPIVTLGGQPGDIPVPGYYDGPSKFEAAIYRPSTGEWFIQGHTGPIQFGSDNPIRPDVPVPEDYDGDGKTDIAVYRPGTQQWFIGSQQPIQFGGPEDIPVPGDYFGDGKAQVAVYRQGNPGTLFIGGVAPISFGGPEDIPVKAPYANREALSPAMLFARSADFGASAAALSVGQGAIASTSTSNAGESVAPRTSAQASAGSIGSSRIRPQALQSRPDAGSFRQFIAQRRLASFISAAD